MNAPPFPVNPIAGLSGGVRVLTTSFTASGAYMPSPGLVSLIVECIGGGGAGGGAQAQVPNPTSNGWYGGGGGGAAGQYSRKVLPAPLVLGGVIVTVGAGGTGGTATAQGSQGGVTSFGALCVANGGWPADPFNLGVAQPVWGTGGWASTDLPGVGDVTSFGSNGANGSAAYYDPANEIGFVAGGNGGNTQLGGGGHGQAIYQATGGFDGQSGFAGTGGGGGGGVSSLITAVQNGGDGGSGLCIVTEYCLVSSGGGGQPDPCNPCWPNIPPSVCWPWGRWDDC